MRFVCRVPVVGLVLVAALAVASCGSGASVPASPGTPTVAAPVPTPTPASGGGDAAANTCPIGKGSPDAACSRTSPQLLSAVEAAIDRIIRDRPALFNLKEESVAGTGQYRVLDKEAYIDGVMANLRSAGLCAARSLDLELVQAKSTNGFSEDFDIWTSSGFIRRSGSAYRQTCTPAAFPLEAADLISYVRVVLWSFDCNPGVTPPLPNEAQMPLGCDAFATATPKQRNGQDVPSWVHGTEVRWELREGQDVVAVEPDTFYSNPFNKILHPKGKIGHIYLCATVLGVEGCLYGHTIP
jgi:hypothetical protein